MTNLVRPVINVGRDVAAFSRLAPEHRSLVRFATDSILFRALRLRPSRSIGGPRQVHLAGDLELTYRLNRGDIQTMREIWLDEIYRLPFDFRPRTVLDLGANIGLASVWFSHTYASTVTSVEPSPENVELLRVNRRSNRVRGEIIEAAVGVRNGIGRFEEGCVPSQGRLSTRGREVEIVGIGGLLERLGRVDLVKMDVEGAEDVLLSDPSWLGRCDSLIAEFHPTLVDYPALIRLVEDKGFVFFRSGSVLQRTCDFFVNASGWMYRNLVSRRRP